MNDSIGIGMPVFNGGKTIRRAIDSLQNQSYRNFKLIISDNASTDETESICREYERLDSRIKYIRQDKNIGIGENFKYVLNQSHEEYFMWAAVDDWWGTNFLLFNVENLKNFDSIIASISRSKFISAKEVDAGDFPILDESLYERRKKYLKNPGINSRLYSIYRRAVLDKININDYMFIGADWALIYDLLQFGGFYKDNREIGFFKSGNGLSSDKVDIKIQSRKKIIGYLFPLHELTGHIIHNNGLFYIPSLLKHNIIYLFYCYPIIHNFLRYLKYKFKK